MSRLQHIVFTALLLMGIRAQSHAQTQFLQFEFLGSPMELPCQKITLDTSRISFNTKGIHYLESILLTAPLEPLYESLRKIRERDQLDDWFFYQLIRRTAQQIIPKTQNYLGYTYCKWLLLYKTGYTPLIRLSNNKVLLYVMSNDSVYNIPFLFRNGNQFVCLNYHDYSYRVDFEHEVFHFSESPAEAPRKNFSYQIRRLPEFAPASYQNKLIRFRYKGREETYTLNTNPVMLTYFTNYPVIDYRYQFSMPFSAYTYRSLIPNLKKRMASFSQTEGVDYLLHFVRDAFVFEKDTEHFGREKRFSPEETLLSEKSDCEDRSALFFALVKEIYNLPMIVLSYPEHVNVAVALNKNTGDRIIYNGNTYTLCEPTPQKKELRLGETMPHLKRQPYEVVVQYLPTNGLLITPGQPQ